MRYLLLLALLLFMIPDSYSQEFYELKKYVITSQEQEKRLDEYLKNAYLPAVKKAGVKQVGVFKPVLSDKDNAGKAVFVLTPFTNLTQFEKLPGMLAKNKSYQEAGRDYLDAAYNNPPYQRIEGTLLRAFAGEPKIKKTTLSAPAGERVYELRSYEGPTEKIYQNKVEMFHKGEFEIFDRLGFNAVFYGEVLAGKDQPNLIYMTSFDSMKSRDEHWDAFRTDAGWDKLKNNPNYQNNVSGRWTYLLFPTDYSDL